jgi:hypothetical protein
LVEAFIILGLLPFIIAPAVALFVLFKAHELDMFRETLLLRGSLDAANQSIGELREKIEKMETEAPKVSDWEQKFKDTESIYQDFLRKVEL